MYWTFLPPCDQDFRLIEKSKKYYPNIYIPDHWKSVITSARKIKPFTVVEMYTNDFFFIQEFGKLYYKKENF